MRADFAKLEKSFVDPYTFEVYDLTEALGRAVVEIEDLRSERDALAAEVANND